MNHIEQAYQQGLKVKKERWGTFWIKKYSDTQSIDEIGRIYEDGWSFKTNPEDWEIWHEDLTLLKDQTDIKQQIQTHLNQIQELLKQL